MRILLVGHGRMGKVVEALAPEYRAQVVAIVGRQSGSTELDRLDARSVDIAIDFTVGDAVADTLPKLVERGINTVVGTTGWKAQEPELRQLVERSTVGVLVAPNFSIGMNVFQLVVEQAAKRFAPLEWYGAWIHEAHHAAKKDAPSGTALQLQSGMTTAGYRRPIDVAATRAGFIPGTHTVGFDGLAETITLTHSVRDRTVFAQGALEAARWLRGRRGWFTMRDMLENPERETAASSQTT